MLPYHGIYRLWAVGAVLRELIIYTAYVELLPKCSYRHTWLDRCRILHLGQYDNNFEHDE